MSPLPCTVLVLGLLAASVSAAEAGNNPSIEVLPQNPTPEPMPPASATAPTAAALAPLPQTRSERRAARHQAMIERRKERRLAALQRHEQRQQAALERRAAKLGLKTPASPAVATATPAAMAGAIESPAPSPAALIGTAAPHDGKAAPTLSDLVARHAIENGVPVKLAQAVVTIESRGNAHASNHGALGLMQIKYGTARAAGFSGAAAGLLVAETNLHFGMKVLADAYRSARGDLCGTLMRYQSGHLATRMTHSNRVYCSRARSLMAGV